jgi:indolepyruvate ferredoxin oxidoreductase
LLETLLASPSLARSELALELASLPDMIRGFGHVKEANVARARQRQTELLASLTTYAGSRKAAE